MFIKTLKTLKNVQTSNWNEDFFVKKSFILSHFEQNLVCNISISKCEIRASEILHLFGINKYQSPEFNRVLTVNWHQLLTCSQYILQC